MAAAPPDPDKQKKALSLFVQHEKYLAGQPSGKRLMYKSADFSQLKFVAINLRDSVLSGSNFSEAKFTDANFSTSDLFCVNAADADFTGSSFDRADLRGANLMRAQLIRTKLTKADLRAGQIVQWRGGEKILVNRASQLSEARLDNASAAEANFSGAEMSRATLAGADFSRAEMYAVNLTGANLSGRLDAERRQLSLGSVAVTPAPGYRAGLGPRRLGNSSFTAI